MPTRSTMISIALALVLTAPAAAVSAQQTESGTAGYVFGARTGVLLFHVRPEHAAAFEQIMARVAGGLRGADADGRAQQATGWRFFRARPEADSAVYLAFIDPVVPGADYDPVRLLIEFAPAEARALFEQLRTAIIRVERLDLDELP